MQGGSNQNAASSSTLKRGKRNFDSVYDLKDRLAQHKEKAKEQGIDLVTKVYPSDVIPDQFNEKKRDYRPNNFLAGELSVIGSGNSLMRQNNRASNSRLMKAEYQFLQQ